MGLISIGPVAVSHGNPRFGLSAAPTEHGIDSTVIAGSCSWAAAKTLRELVRNPYAQTSVGTHTGVLEMLVFDDNLLEDWTGPYLLEKFDSDPDQPDSLADTDCPFTLTAAFLGTLA